MIRNLTPGRVVYRVNFNDVRTNAYRPHVEPLTVLGTAHPLNNGAPVARIGYQPAAPWQTGVTEAMCKFLFPTPERAAAAYIREWTRNGRTVEVDMSEVAS